MTAPITLSRIAVTARSCCHARAVNLSRIAAVLIRLSLPIALAVTAPRAHASESELEEAPPPASAEEIAGQLERPFEPTPERTPLFPALRDALRDLPPFFRDATASVRLRSRYLHRRRFDDTRAETWAGGGSAHVQSGWLADTASVELGYFTSQRLEGDPDRDGALYLEPGQHGFGVLGVANLKLRTGPWTLVAYRQELDLPYVNGNDSRMVPNTFEAVTLRREGDDADWIASQIWRIKPRDEDEFVSIPALAGEEANRPLSLVGLNWTPTADTQVGAFGYYSRDVGVASYVEAGWLRELPRGVTTRLEGQATSVRTVSDALLAGGDRFTTWQLGLRGSVSWKGWLAQLAATHTNDGGPIQSRFGSSPSYLDRMQHGFSRAGENALGLALVWSFEESGAPGLSLRWDVTQGWGGEDDSGMPSDRLESDLTLDYKPLAGRWRGLWLRLRGAVLYDDEADPTQNEVRLEIQYDLELL